MSAPATFGFEKEFQELLIATSLQDPVFLVQNHDVLLPNYLDYDYLTTILRIARELTERLGSVPTKTSVVEEVKDYCQRFNIETRDREFILNKLEELYQIEQRDTEYIRERIVEFGQRQAIRSAVMSTVSMMQKPDGLDIDKTRSLFETAFNIGFDTRDLGLNLYPNLTTLPTMAATSKAGNSRKVPCGIPTIDRNTGGGPGRGEVWVVVGEPGRGKSRFLVNIGAAAVKAGLPVVHYTVGDLNETDVGVRYAARLTMSTTLEVISGDPAYLRKAEKLARYNPFLFIKYWPSQTVSISAIGAHLAKLRTVEEVQPAVIIVDYPEEFKRTKGENLYLEGEANYSYLNKTANDYDAVVWASSQPKNVQLKHKNDVITGQNMGESSRKFHKIDGMLSYNQTYEEEHQGRGRIWVDKTRRNKSFYLVHTKIDAERMVVQECEPPSEVDDDA